MLSGAQKPTQTPPKNNNKLFSPSCIPQILCRRRRGGRGRRCDGFFSSLVPPTEIPPSPFRGWAGLQELLAHYSSLLPACITPQLKIASCRLCVSSAQPSLLCWDQILGGPPKVLHPKQPLWCWDELLWEPEGEKARMGSPGICGCSGFNPLQPKRAKPPKSERLDPILLQETEFIPHPQSQHMTLGKSFMIQRPLKPWRVTFPLAGAGDLPAPPASRGKDEPEKHLHGAAVPTPLPSPWNFG